MGGVQRHREQGRDEERVAAREGAAKEDACCTRGFGISASASCPRKHGSGTCLVMWRVNAGVGGEEELVDYVQHSSTQSHAVVFRAGHLVPVDNSLDTQARGIS
ncbi:hypothetical protein PR202_gb25679 [Eleusine coracana subsp. coracana]|uniref:Uncharacterized protein n=1 Tax=Eleusine coracana subsp. coracana TaxID=191504 RepID=A0AAV5FPK0_ELECO|nr:hypothetical protein PR202_gb25679 [Eleusine coracana subsp. coracana]